MSNYLTTPKVIKAVQRGENWAMKAIYDHYSGLFFAIALRYCSDSQEAEDHVQEAFVRIFKSAKGFAFQGSFEGWMKRILVNHCLNGLKKNRVLKNHEEISDHMKASYSTSANIVEGMNADEILRCIQKLPPGYRTVLNMYILEGFSHREIGEHLGITESSSRSQLTKARLKLKGILAEEGLLDEGRQSVA
jgi:RNA polymerase sigma-70 factor (ECF subfamily)